MQRVHRYLNSHPGLARKEKRMSYIEKVNQEIKKMVSEGYAPEQAIYELALSAGLPQFNPSSAKFGNPQICAPELLKRPDLS